MKNLIILLFCCAFVLSGADLKSKALFPVKWQKNAPHEPLKLVENGKLNFVIVYDEKSEPVKMLKTRKSARIADILRKRPDYRFPAIIIHLRLRLMLDKEKNEGKDQSHNHKELQRHYHLLFL